MPEENIFEKYTLVQPSSCIVKIGSKVFIKYIAPSAIKTANNSKMELRSKTTCLNDLNIFFQLSTTNCLVSSEV